MSALETLLAGLIDYAGLYPPAGLDMREAVRNYLGYRTGKHAFALGRFIVDLARLEELREAGAGSLSQIRLSVIANATATPPEIESIPYIGLAIESFEIKCTEPLSVCRINERLPLRMERYFEIPIQPGCSGAADAIASIGARAKLRMGGIVPEAFPPPGDVVDWLQLAADRRIAFKATAGLHHPIRSRHRLTYAPESPCATMHGFINFFCAAAFIHSGAAEYAIAVLEEEDSGSFRISSDAVAWRAHQWTTDQVRTIRKEFFTSYGSCSFVEPLQDLEELGWL
jgi:hypothetical protein